MATTLGLLELVVLLALQTSIAALAVRFVRVRFDSRVATVVFVLLLVPIALTLSTFLFSGIVGLGTDLGSRRTAVYLVIAVPLALGLAIDYLWMPAPGLVGGSDAGD